VFLVGLLAQHLSFEINFGFVQVFLEVKGCFDFDLGFSCELFLDVF